MTGLETADGILNDLGNPIYYKNGIDVAKIEKVMTEMSPEQKEALNTAVQELVENKYPDYKENQGKQATELNIQPLQEGENIETRRINNLQKSGINPYKPHKIILFEGVKKHKSVWRAMRRGHVSVIGEVFPNRPFTNKKNAKVNEIKKQIYGEYKKIASRV